MHVFGGTMTRIKSGFEVPACRRERIWQPAKISSLSFEDFTVSIQRSRRWTKCLEDESEVSYREAYCEITSKDDFVGFIEFVEIRMKWVDNEELFFELDAVSQAFADLATAICERWEDVFTEVGCFGPILVLDRVWVRPDYRNTSIWLRVANHLLDTIYDNRSFMILKPFPLEYEGKVEELNEFAFEARTQAMRRYYSRVLGAKPLGESGHSAKWMWVPYACE
jgi:hypothetical protein